VLVLGLPLPCGDEFDLAVTGVLIQHLCGREWNDPSHPSPSPTLIKAQLPIGSTRMQFVRSPSRSLGSGPRIAECH
jgi:hypothetical protein